MQLFGDTDLKDEFANKISILVLPNKHFFWGGGQRNSGLSYQEGACVLQNNISCYSLNHNPPSSWLLKHGKNSAFKKKNLKE